MSDALSPLKPGRFVSLSFGGGVVTCELVIVSIGLSSSLVCSGKEGLVAEEGGY